MTAPENEARQARRAAGDFLIDRHSQNIIYIRNPTEVPEFVLWITERRT